MWPDPGEPGDGEVVAAPDFEAEPGAEPVGVPAPGDGVSEPEVWVGAPEVGEVVVAVGVGVGVVPVGGGTL